MTLRTERTVTVRILINSIKLVGKDREDIQDGIRDSLTTEIPEMEKLMPILSSLITVAPILGLTGTVLGLMDIFQVISGGGIGDTAQLSSGIAEALITTVTGLLIVVPFIFAYQYLSQKIEHQIVHLEKMSFDMVSFCKHNYAVKD